MAKPSIADEPTLVTGPVEISPEEQAAKLEQLAVEVATLGQKSSAHTFLVGAVLAKAKALVPPKQFGKWVKQRCGYDVRSAWNYVSVYEQLSSHRERLEKAAVPATVMFTLLKADDQQIETVISSFEENKRLTVAEVKELVTGLGTREPETEKDDPFNTAGMKAIGHIANLKAQSDIAAFIVLMKDILVKVESAMATGKRVGVGDLASAIETDCRHAYALMRAFALPLRPNDLDLRGRWYSEDLPKGTAWQQVYRLLEMMLKKTSWPAKSEFDDWLKNEVVPMLRFVVHAEPMNIVETAQVASPVPDIGAKTDILGTDVLPIKLKSSMLGGVAAHVEALLHDTMPNATHEQKQSMMDRIEFRKLDTSKYEIVHDFRVKPEAKEP